MIARPGAILRRPSIRRRVLRLQPILRVVPVVTLPGTGLTEIIGALTSHPRRHLAAPTFATSPIVITRLCRASGTVMPGSPFRHRRPRGRYTKATRPSAAHPRRVRGPRPTSVPYRRLHRLYLESPFASSDHST